MNFLNVVIGEQNLFAWQPAHGITWVQTCSPECAALLFKRRDARVVTEAVAGGYLRIVEFHHSLACPTACGTMVAPNNLFSEFHPLNTIL
jgi:hypothetical protein